MSLVSTKAARVSESLLCGGLRPSFLVRENMSLCHLKLSQHPGSL